MYHVYKIRIVTGTIGGIPYTEAEADEMLGDYDTLEEAEAEALRRGIDYVAMR